MKRSSSRLMILVLFALSAGTSTALATAAEPQGQAPDGAGSVSDVRGMGRNKPAEPVPAEVKLGTLSQSDIISAMRSIQPKVQACANQFGVWGTVLANIQVASGGRVTSATATGRFAGTPAGACVEVAATSARLPPCQAINFPWPFTLGREASAKARAITNDNQAALDSKQVAQMHYRKQIQSWSAEGRSCEVNKQYAWGVPHPHPKKGDCIVFDACSFDAGPGCCKVETSTIEEGGDRVTTIDPSLGYAVTEERGTTIWIRGHCRSLLKLALKGCSGGNDQMCATASRYGSNDFNTQRTLILEECKTGDASACALLADGCAAGDEAACRSGTARSATDGTQPEHEPGRSTPRHP